jgi:hypothetical protein
MMITIVIHEESVTGAGVERRRTVSETSNGQKGPGVGARVRSGTVTVTGRKSEYPISFSKFGKY